MKINRSLLCMILTFTMLLTLAAASASADGGIKIAGTELVPGVWYRSVEDGGIEPYPDGGSPSGGDGYIIMQDSSTLLLHDITVKSKTVSDESDWTFAGIYVPASIPSLTIITEGENKISFKGYYPTDNGDGSYSGHSYGINASGSSLTVTGSGTLTVKSKDFSDFDGSSESIAIAANSINIYGSVSVSASAGGASSGNSFGIYSGSVVLSDPYASITAEAETAAFTSSPVSNAYGYDIAFNSDGGSETAYLAEVYVEPEPTPFVDTREPAEMPDAGYFYVSDCTTADNNDGYIALPEGYSYEWRAGTDGAFIPVEGNGLYWLAPGTYQIRVSENDEHLASEPCSFTVEAYVEPVDMRQPAVMPGTEYCTVSPCTTAENNNGCIALPEGYSYEWRAGTDGAFIPVEGNGLYWLAPGTYQIRVSENDEHLASEPCSFTVEAYVEPTADPVVTPTAEPVSVPKIIKQPGSETGHTVGDTVLFTAACTEDSSAAWFFNDGIPIANIGSVYPGLSAEISGTIVSGVYPGTKLTIHNVTRACSNMSVYVEFTNESGTVRSDNAVITVTYGTDPLIALPPTPPVSDPVVSPSASPVYDSASENKDDTMQIASPDPVDTVEIEPDFTKPVMSATAVAPVEINGDISVDTGDGEKAADTVFLMTENDALPEEPIPEGITFSAVTDKSGFLSVPDSLTNLKYKLGLDSGSYVDLAVTDGKSTITGLGDGSVICIIKAGDGSTTKDSEPLTLTVHKSPEPKANSFTTTACQTLSQSDGTLTVPSGNKYEFTETGSKNYVLIEGNTDSPVTVTGIHSGTYYIRVRAAGDVLASEPAIVEIEAYTAPDARPAPDVKFSADSDCTGTLTGVDSTMNYRLGKDSAWNTISGSSIYFTNLCKGLVIQVYYPATETQIESPVKEIVIDQQEAPTEKFVKVTDCTDTRNNNGTIVLSCENYTDYEIRFGTSGEFTKITAPKITGLSNGTYQLRTRAKGVKLASKLCNVIVSEYIPKGGITCQGITMLPYEKIFDTTDGYSTLTVSFYPLNTTDQTVTFYSSNTGVVNFGSQSAKTVGTNGTATIRMYPVGTGEATITATTPNGKTATCHVTVSFEYRFTYNKSGTWYYDRGGDYTVQTNGPMSRFAALKINGQTVNPQYYTTRTNSDGTTILTISQYAMSCLNHGAYQKLQLCYNDGGTATTFLHIMSVNDRPITGDGSCVGRWIALGTLSLICLAAALFFVRRKKNS